MKDITNVEYCIDEYDSLKRCVDVFGQFKAAFLAYGPIIRQCKDAGTLVASAKHDSGLRAEVVMIENEMKMMALEELSCREYELHRNWTVPSTVGAILLLPHLQIAGYA